MNNIYFTYYISNYFVNKYKIKCRVYDRLTDTIVQVYQYYSIFSLGSMAQWDN